jgi:hypothetical protein
MTKENCKYCKTGDPCITCMIQDELEKKNKRTKKTKEDMKKYQKKDGTISLMDIVKEDKK